MHCLPRLALHVSLKAVARLRPRARLRALFPRRAAASKGTLDYPNVGPQLRPPSQAQGCRPCSPPMGSLGMFSLDSCYWCGRVVQPRCYNPWAVEMTPCDTCERGYPEGHGGVGLLVRTMWQARIPASVAPKIVATMCGTMADDVRPGARRWHLACVLLSHRRAPRSPFAQLRERPGWIAGHEEWQTCFHLIFLFLGEKW